MSKSGRALENKPSPSHSEKSEKKSSVKLPQEKRFSANKPHETSEKKESLKDPDPKPHKEKHSFFRKLSEKSKEKQSINDSANKPHETSEKKESLKDPDPKPDKEKHSFFRKLSEKSKEKQSIDDPNPVLPRETRSLSASQLKFIGKRRSLKDLAPPIPEEDALILKGEEIPLPPLKTTFGYFLCERLLKHKDKILQVDVHNGSEVHGIELHVRAACVATELLTRLGKQVTGESKIVAAVLDNGTSASYALIGTLYARATFVPVNPDLNEDDLKHVLTLLSPDFVFCTPRAMNNVKAVVHSKCFIMETCHGSKIWESIINRSRVSDSFHFNVPKEIASVNDPMIIMCSSGTMGPPKGVTFSHKAIHRMVLLREVLSDRKPLREAAGTETTLVADPFSWVSGLIPTLSSCASGWLLLQFDRFDVDHVLGAVQKHRVTAISLSTPLIAAIASNPRASEYDASAVALFRFGGTSLNRDVRKRAEEKLKKKLTYHYGLTECPWPVKEGSKADEKPNTVGVVAPNTWIKIADFKTGRALKHNCEGEICIKSELMFTGYYKDPNATEEALDPHGWLHTGDVGYYDTDGYIFMTDRFKERIRYKGYQFSPKEIEDVIINHPAVKEVAVVGEKDDEGQERPVAFVVVKSGHFVSSEELKKMVHDKLPEHKHLDGGIYFGTELPKSQGGKIKRRELNEKLNVKNVLKTKTSIVMPIQRKEKSFESEVN